VEVKKAEHKMECVEVLADSKHAILDAQNVEDRGGVL